MERTVNKLRGCSHQVEQQCGIEAHARAAMTIHRLGRMQAGGVTPRRDPSHRDGRVRERRTTLGCLSVMNYHLPQSSGMRNKNSEGHYGTTMLKDVNFGLLHPNTGVLGLLGCGYFFGYSGQLHSNHFASFLFHFAIIRFFRHGSSTISCVTC